MNRKLDRIRMLGMAAVMGVAVALAGCNSDDVVEAIVGTSSVSGTVFDENDAAASGVTVEGILADGVEDSTTTDANGAFSVDLVNDIPIYLKFSKSGYVTLNTEYETLDGDLSGFEVDMVPVADAETIIDLAFASAFDLADKGWLAVYVVDGSDAAVGGIDIGVDPTADGEAYITCDAAGPSGTITDDCTGVTDVRDGIPHYLAYFDADEVVEVTVGGETKSAPVIVGEVTFIEFVQ